MPKELRSELHERFGRWLEANRSEYEEIVGYHYERAFKLKEQLGPGDDELRALGARAGRLLGHAGHRAYERGDIPAAVTLLTRATDLLPAGDKRRLELLVELGYALHDAGELERAKAVFSGAIEEGEAAGEKALEARGRIGKLFVDVLTGAAAFGAPRDALQLEIAKLEELHDDLGLAEAWIFSGNLESWLGRSELAGDSYGKAIEHARRAGNRRLVAMSIGVPQLLRAWGFAPAAAGLRACDELLIEYGGTSIEPALRVARSLYLSLIGEADAARAENALGDELYGQFGNELLRSAIKMSLADLEIRVGRFEEAEVAARDGVEGLELLGEQGFRSTASGFLAEALCRQGRYEEADEWAQITADLAMEDDFDPQFRWRAVRARVFAARGEFTEAERLAREAVEIVGETDWHLHRGQAVSVLAEVLEHAGRTDDARAYYEEAIQLFERKESLPDAEATRRRLADLA
jgi:tetratricopeptide (TPR) repeat protein